MDPGSINFRNFQVARKLVHVQTNWFIIFQAREAWWIDNEGSAFGPFASKEAASAEAISIARKFGDKERRSLVYLPNERGYQQLIWEGT